MYLPWLGASPTPTPGPPVHRVNDENEDADDDDLALTEAMVHDLMHKNQRLSSNLHTLQRAYNQLLDGGPSEVNGHGPGGQHEGHPE